MKSSPMMLAMGVDQPLAREGYLPLSMRWASVAAQKALVVEAPYQRLVEVAGVSGKVANPYPYYRVSEML